MFVKRLLLVLLILLFSLLLSCGDSSSPAEADDVISSDITIEGTLAPASTENLGVDGSLAEKTLLLPKDGSSASLEQYELYCVTFEETPTAGSGNADSSGKFSLTLKGAKDVAFGCFIRKDGAVVATMVFEDTTQDSLNGGNSRSGNISLSGDSNLGTIVLDLERGVAVVDVANIKTETAEKGNFDFSGTWKLETAKFSPEGYEAMCVQGDETCHGPTEGMSVYLKRLVGTDSVGNPSYGIMVWLSKKAFQSCGSTFGLSVDDLKQYTDGISIDLIQSDINAGAYNWNVGGDTGLFFTGSTGQTDWSGWAIDAAKGYYDDGSNEYQDYTCNTISTGDSDLIRCFSEYLWKQNFDFDENSCIKDVRPHYDLTTNQYSLIDDGMNRPKTEFVFENWNYTAKNSGSFSQHEEWEDSVDSGNDNWVQCQIHSYFTMNVTVLSDTKAIADMQQVTTLMNTDEAACVANEQQLGISESRVMVDMTKLSD